SATGNAANTIAVAATNSPTSIQANMLEYQQASGGIDASLVGTTGNSASPASGNYTPATAGDLIITAFARSANVSPTALGSNFLPRICQNSASGTLAVGDNWGANSIAAGMVNFAVVGTEE